MLTSVSPHSAPQHPLDHAAIDGADDRVLDRHIAERAVVVDDAQLVVALVGVRGEPVRSERVGHRVQRRTQRALSGGEIGAGEAGAIALPVLDGRPARPSPRPGRWAASPAPCPAASARGRRCGPARRDDTLATRRGSAWTGGRRPNPRPARRRPRGSRRRRACRGDGGRRWGGGRTARRPGRR